MTIRSQRIWVAIIVVVAGAIIAGRVWMAVPRIIVPRPFTDPTPESTLRALADNPAVVMRGNQLFLANCTLCHGIHGEGGSGPNLRDHTWIYGSDLRTIVDTISNGRDGGMAAWNGTFSSDDIHALAVYVRSLSPVKPAP